MAALVVRGIASHTWKVALLGLGRVIETIFSHREAGLADECVVVDVTLEPVVHGLDLLLVVIVRVLALGPPASILIELVK